jgi:hypothetical protein
MVCTGHGPAAAELHKTGQGYFWGSGLFLLMISGGVFRQTSNRGGDFFFCSKRSHGNPFFDHQVGYREIGVDGIGSIKHSGSTSG